MKIAFLLGSPDISGGTYVIFEHATRLNQKNHQVVLVTEEPVEAKRFSWHPSAKALSWRTFTDLEDELFDVTIATWWQSVYLLSRVKSRKYLYFIQSIESRFFPERDSSDPALTDADIIRQWCESTYRIALPVITEARWIQDYLLEHHNRSSFLVRNGIRKDIYTEKGPAFAPRHEGRLRVLVEGPLGISYKNVEKTIELCLQAGVDEIWLLTSTAINTYTGVDRCFSRIPILETAEIYRSCDILVKLSYVEGMFGPPLEMFHCGGTAIVYDVTGHDEYIRHGENSLVVKKDDESQVVQWLKDLKDNKDLLEKLKKGAAKTARDWPDWDDVAEKFSQAIECYDQSLPDMSATFLTESSGFMLAARDNGLRARELSRLAEREQQGADVSSSVVNHIQVYWDCGHGIQDVLTDSYQSGDWCRCSVVLPCEVAPKVLRVDPSVRAGVVEIRSLTVSGLTSKKIYANWNKGSNWGDIAVTGTACTLRSQPFLMLEAYGEDPQLFLPHIPQLPDNEELKIEIEVREMGFAQALATFSDIVQNDGISCFSRLRRFSGNLVRKIIPNY